MDAAPIQLPAGLHLDVPFETYLQLPLYSQSILKEARRSMAHLRAAFNGQLARRATDDMILGSALHVAFLEPAQAAARIAVWDGGTRRGKDWESFKAFHSARIIITQNQSIHLKGMITSLRRHPLVASLLGQIDPARIELSAIGQVSGLPMKGRADALPDGSDVIIDLKKSADADARAFMRSVRDFGYDLQGYIYSQLFQRPRMLLIVVEDEPPYDVVPYELSAARLRQGQREAEQTIARVIECESTGLWPGRADGIVTLDLAEWEGTSSVDFGE